MANIKSAKKRVLQTAGKQKRNKSARAHLRSAVKKYGQAEGKAKSDALPTTYSEIDRARRKGVIHKNAAARYKSRLAKKAAK